MSFSEKVSEFSIVSGMTKKLVNSVVIEDNLYQLIIDLPENNNCWVLEIKTQNRE
jgi:hypothetical protein